MQAMQAGQGMPMSRARPPAGDAADVAPARWRAARLLDGPHRLCFFWAGLSWAAAAAWWAAHLLSAALLGSVWPWRVPSAEADTCCTPGYESVTLKNLQADQPAFLFIADESPLHRKLGVYENRG